LLLEDITASSNTYRNLGTAWAEGTDRLTVHQCRLGGDYSGHQAAFRLRTRMKLPGGLLVPLAYRGVPLSEVTLAPRVYMRDSACSSTGAGNWLEIHDEFPSLIDIRSVMPFPINTTDPRAFLSLNSWGIWVSDRVDMSEIARRPRMAVQI